MVQYSPLDPQKSEIRLITLLPGKSRDAIRCTLSTTSLDSAPEYTALSYAWGDPSKTIPIIVDNEPFDVTVNLEAGLRAIRKRWRRRLLWIDAICINQNDVQEKNVQVPQMGRLYSTAPAVLMWLGPSTPNIKLFVSWMRAHATKAYNAASAYWMVKGVSAALSENAKRQRDCAVVRAYEGYNEFLALSYWVRLWTFQEYILPRTAPMCLCGNIQPFHLTTVLGKLDCDTLRRLDDEATARLYAEMGRGRMNKEMMAMLAQVIDRRLTKGLSVPSIDVLQFPSLRDYHEESLATLLYNTAHRQCFDEHDKIFALYGLVPAVQDIYPPDYKKPITDVMLQVATFIVNVEQHGSFMWHCFGLRDERLSDASRLYPSWVPDFTQTYVNFVFMSTTRNLNLHVMDGKNGEVAMSPQLSEYRPACVSVECTTLRLWARRLGTCKVAVRFANTRSDVLEQIKELLKVDAWENCMGKSVRKPETFVSRMTRACVAHYASFSDISTKDILEAFYLVFNSGPDTLPEDISSPFRYDILSVARGLMGKDLLITEDGCFGISVGGAKDGDIIVIPPEFEHPFVLTPESSNSVDGVGYFKMVGTAIIDGVMGAGELFDEELVEEIAKRDVVEFLIH